MDTSIKKLLEFAGVDITKGKAKELYEKDSSWGSFGEKLARQNSSLDVNSDEWERALFKVVAAEKGKQVASAKFHGDKDSVSDFMSDNADSYKKYVKAHKNKENELRESDDSSTKVDKILNSMNDAWKFMDSNSFDEEADDTIESIEAISKRIDQLADEIKSGKSSNVAKLKQMCAKYVELVDSLEEYVIED